ncbi:Ras guanine nucleotide exchange factor [Tieghemostelium lacteum]|uniref:Ras guanine nucleotide exchange factor n=1 Tax=Tieghemostelium lacteum TaxID=361077 RepID=A0A152A6A6_TIELA|nr:Ras guanine nucleotide exchange factor [Tieghemostelium lacteum]|eukprot:KYR01769.1 Ras guanine nucleotide exchange factor [Tieghemostelium lacteum]
MNNNDKKIGGPSTTTSNKSTILNKLPTAPSLPPVTKTPVSSTNTTPTPSSPSINNSQQQQQLQSSPHSITGSPVFKSQNDLKAKPNSGNALSSSSSSINQRSNSGGSSTHSPNSSMTTQGSPSLFNRTTSTLAQLSNSSLPNAESSPPTSSLNSSSSSPTTESLLYTEEGNQDPFTKNGNIYLGLKSTTGGEIGHSGHTCVSSEDTLYFFGGQLQDGTFTNDFYSYQFSTRTWTILPSPSIISARSQHSAIVYNNSMYIFGGYSTTGLKNDIQVFSFESQTWSELTIEGTVKPTVRYGHSAIIDRTSMIVFGGTVDGGQTSNEIYSFNLESKNWSLIACQSTPTGRSMHTSTLHKGVMWIVGGQLESTSPTDEIYQYSLANNQWTKVNLEGSTFTPRSNHTATLLLDSIIVTGGNPKSNQIEIFEIDLYQKKCYKIRSNTQGQNRYSHSGHVGPKGSNSIILWGGLGSETSIDYFSFGKDEFEEELLQEDDFEYNRIQNIPKNHWESTLMKKHPEILDLRERTAMLTGIKPYAKALAQPSYTENKNAISHQFVLEMIMEYLEQHTPYRKTIQAIQKETGIIHQLTESSESRLISLLRLAKPRLRNKNVFDTDLDVLPKDEQSTDPEIQFVDNLYRRIENEEEDINVWDEGDDNTRNIKKTEIGDSGKITIKAATINKLVHYLAPEKDKANDVNFLKAFLYTHTSFTTSENLLKKLIQRYNVPAAPSGSDASKYKSDVVDPIRHRVCSVLKYWIDKCPWDFKLGIGADKLVASLYSFIDGSLTRDGNANIKKLRSLLQQVRNNELSSSLVYSTNPPEPKVPRNIFSPQLQFSHIDELEIARQLTLIEYRIFRNIPPPEFLVRVTSFGDFQYSMATSPNLITFLNRSTDVSKWVVYTVLLADKKKDRIKMLEKHIKVMESLRILNNYQTLYSIYQGLQQHYIQSLPDLISPRTKEVLAEYDNLFSKTDNYKVYREILAKSPHPCIPWITVVQEEIATIEKDQPSLMNNLINFVKRQDLYKIVSNVEEYQLRPYNLQPVHQISTFINKLPKVSDSELTELATKQVAQ